MTKMPDELGYLLSTLYAAKQLGGNELSGVLSDPWRFGEWVDGQSGSDRRAFRHMLLYLCFPASYERIGAGGSIELEHRLLPGRSFFRLRRRNY